MILTIIISVVSLLLLIVLHELGHFLLAKKFGVRVDEFGIGLPPRIFGRKFGETIYSLNLIPFGAFVRIYGEEERIDDPRSFTTKPFWQKALIIVGGVLVFWLVSAVLLSFVMVLGVPSAVQDQENQRIREAKVQILQVVADSPAEKAGIKIGDIIKGLSISDSKIQTDKVKEVQEFSQVNKGNEITLTIQRGRELFDVSLTPRAEPPADEGPLGVVLIRTALKSYPWYEAPFRGTALTGQITLATVQGLGSTFLNLVKGQGLPRDVEFRGPVGIVEFFGQTRHLGLNYLLQLISVISIFLALFNILPIPALDGGKLLFLIIEAIRRKPLPQKIESSITTVFFALLLALIVFITVKDIQRLI